MTNRFPEMWLTQGLLDCSFDEGVEHLAVLFMNALQLKDTPPESPPARRGPEAGPDE